MHTIGIIAEYNPFHLGHEYQIKKIKELYHDSIIIVIISPSFTQRGEPSLINKWDKTKICLENNIDIVLEFPTLYATQSADIFASNALKILNEFKIDLLAFGSETNDLELFKKLANTQLKDDKYDKLVQEYLKKGLNYPTAKSKALEKITNFKIDKPNDILALSYIKEIIKNNYKIKPFSIKRNNNYHGTEVNGNIINASLIRKMYLSDKNIDNYVPNNVSKYMQKINHNKIFNYLKYQIINTEDLSIFLSVDEGIENRIIKNINSSNNIDELINKVKSKRYTYNKINRMFLHILLGVKKTDNYSDLYIKILGFNKKGQTYLNKIKKDIKLPIFTNYKPNKNKTLDLEYKITKIYSLITNKPELIEYEYKNKPIIK